MFENFHPFKSWEDVVNVTFETPCMWKGLDLMQKGNKECQIKVKTFNTNPYQVTNGYYSHTEATVGWLPYCCGLGTTLPQQSGKPLLWSSGVSVNPGGSPIKGHLQLKANS